jgi:hypothetical protein
MIDKSPHQAAIQDVERLGRLPLLAHDEACPAALSGCIITSTNRSMIVSSAVKAPQGSTRWTRILTVSHHIV